MTHSGPVPGKFVTLSQKVDNPNFKCSGCRGNDINFREWESNCGGYEDICYKCNSCGKIWWVEGIDS